MTRLTRIAALFAALCATSAGASAQEELRLAHNMPLQHHLHRGAEAMAEYFNANNDRFHIEIFGAGQLYNEKALVQSAQTGSVDIAFATSNFWSGTAPLVSIVDYPLLFSSYEEAREAFDGALGSAIAEQIEQDNVKVIGYMHYGFNDTILNSVRAITRPSDFEGLRLRTPNALGAAMFTAVGAGATVLPASDVYMAIQRGTIDGTLTGSTATVQRKFFEVADHATILPLQYSVQPITVSMRTWDKLDEDERATLREAARRGSTLTSQLAEEEAEKSIAEFSESMDVVRLNEEEIDALRDVMEPVADDYIGRIAGEAGTEALEAAKAQAQATTN